MKKTVTQIIKNPLFTGSAIMVVGSNLTNVISYLYHLILGRLLGPSDYGVLVSVISVFSLLIASFSFLNIVVVKFVSAAKEKEIPDIIAWFDSQATKFGLLFAIILICFIPFMSRFIDIQYSLLLLVPVLVFLNIKKTIYIASINGVLKFKQAVISSNIEAIFKLSISTILVYAGFSVFGAFSGFVLASLFAIGILRFLLKKYLHKKHSYSFNDSQNVMKYAFPIFLNSLAMMSFFSSDVILVKHFFSSYDVGIYGALSNMGKIIFYSLAPVSVVMFPLISKKHAKGENTTSIFLLSSFLVGSGISVVLFTYYFFPELVIKILFGSQFISGAPYLFYFGLLMSIFSFDSLVINYYLSREKLRPVVLVVGASLMQIIGIWIYHGSIQTVINVSLLSVCSLSLGLMIYFWYEKKAYSKISS